VYGGSIFMIEWPVFMREGDVVSGEQAVIQAYEHAAKMAEDAGRPLYESLQWAAKAEAFAFALCQYAQELTGPRGLIFWHEQAVSASRIRQQCMEKLSVRLRVARNGLKERSPSRNRKGECYGQEKLHHKK
jgi:hypothetical protein